MHFDLDEIKSAENLERYCDDYLDKRGNRNYNCPFCGSGTGPKASAAFNLDNQGHFHCFSCGQGGDLLDLVGFMEGLPTFEERAERAAEFCGVQTDDFGTTYQKPTTRPKYTPKASYDEGRKDEAERLAVWVEQYPNSVGEVYAKQRGIDAYPLTYGWDAKRQRLIIKWPGCDWYHIDRDVTEKHAHKYEKPRTGDVGPQPLFTTGVADSSALVVVEGALDAGALMALGFGDVAALCGTGYRDLLNHLTAGNYKGGVVLMLDNDDAGRSASKRLYGELGKAGIAAYEFKWEATDEKDADEAVRSGHGDELKARVAAALDTAADMAREEEGSPNLRLVDPFEVAEHIFLEDDADTPIPTGIAQLDEMIGLGLMPALYVLGATSSFGKTTLTVQIADYVARKHPVLLVSVEQSAKEIVAKSLSRITHDRHNSVDGGLTAQEITTTTARRAWGADKYDALTFAIGRYTATTAPNIRILEGVTKPTVAEIRRAARDMQSEFGEAPCVFIDYLQLLAPTDDRMSDKQAVDANVTALRILARDLKTPVWCVATLNRESYSGPVDLDSFKESGSIEYGADYALGLQPQGIAAEVQSVKSAVEKKLKGNTFISKAKRDNPRKVELTVLKNRQGETTGTDSGIPLMYYPRTNIFMEA